MSFGKGAGYRIDTPKLNYSEILGPIAHDAYQVLITEVCQNGTANSIPAILACLLCCFSTVYTTLNTIDTGKCYALWQVFIVKKEEQIGIALSRMRLEKGTSEALA